mgnify:FL=1
MPETWKTVPKPPAVAALPANTAGLPVPWNASWTTRPERVHYRAGCGFVLDCDCVHGHGTPRYGEQCMRRQRQAMIERRCGLCGRTIASTDTVVFYGSPAQALLFIEPPTHPSCMAYAVRVCPRLAAYAEASVVLLTRDYLLLQRRALTADPQETAGYGLFDLDDALACLAGVLDFYVAVPTAPKVVPVTEWLLATRAARTP